MVSRGDKTAASLLGGSKLSGSRLDLVKRGVKMSISSNLFLALVKGMIGYITSSQALLADAANSATDVVSSIAVWIGVKKAHTPPDREHPYGHGKAESIAAIIVSVLVGVVGIEVGYQSIQAFFTPMQAPGGLAIVAALLSILIKEVLFRYTIRLGKKTKSQALIVSAWDHRADVISTMVVLIGITGAIIGEMVGLTWLVYLDPVAGIAVAGWILKMAFRLGKDSIDQTMDRVLDQKQTKELEQVVMKVAGVIKVDQLWARQHGPFMIIDVKVAVDSKLSVEEGHQIGKEVKQRLLNESPDVMDVFVHINPYS